jgi:hypothetical protein
VAKSAFTALVSGKTEVADYLIISGSHLKQPRQKHRAHMLEGLRKAGWQESGWQE